jgi:hypothetical protein
MFEGGAGWKSLISLIPNKEVSWYIVLKRIVSIL